MLDGKAGGLDGLHLLRHNRGVKQAHGGALSFQNVDSVPHLPSRKLNGNHDRAGLAAGKNISRTSLELSINAGDPLPFNDAQIS